MPRKPKPELRQPDPPPKFTLESTEPQSSTEPDCMNMLTQIEAMPYDRDRAMQEFWMVVKLGVQFKQLAAVVAAVKNRADLHGLAAARKLELTGKDGEPLTFAVVNYADLPSERPVDPVKRTVQ